MGTMNQIQHIIEDVIMDMFDFIEANEDVLVESQSLRADWYEITGVHYDGYVYYLDIRARRGSEEALSDGPKWFEGEMSGVEIMDAVEASKGSQLVWNRHQ